MGDAPTIYGYPSVPYDLGPDYQRVYAAVTAWAQVEIMDMPRSFDAIWQFFKTHYHYIAEPKGEDRWLHPLQFVQLGGGDCEDFALAFASACVKVMGAAPSTVFVTVYYDLISTEARYHAVCAVRNSDADFIILDQRARFGTQRDWPDQSIIPLFSINMEGQAFMHGRPSWPDTI